MLQPTFVVSPLLSIPTVEQHDVEARWHKDKGLRVKRTGSSPYLTFFAPTRLGTEGREYVVVDWTARGSPPLVLEWTDEQCPEFGAACQMTARPPPHSASPITFDLGGRLKGRVDQLRLSLPPGLDQLVIHSVRISAYPESQPNTRVELTSPDKSPKIVSIHNMEVSQEDSKTHLAIPNVGKDPYFAIPTDFAADTVDYVLLRFEHLPDQAIDIYFAGEQCPTFSDRCRFRIAHPKRPGFWVGQTKVVKTWKGSIKAVRIDFNGPRAEAVLRDIRFVSRDLLAEEIERERERENSGTSAARLDRLAGRMGWHVSAGERLVCRFPQSRATVRELPAALDVRVPAAPGRVEFGEFRARWRMRNETTNEAGLVDAIFSRSVESGWQSLPLNASAMDDPEQVTGLEIDFLCTTNCDALSNDPFHAQIAQPTFRYRTRDATEAPNLILVSLDTLRADHLAPYHYPRDVAPALNEWAQQSTVYESVYAVDTWTLPTHASLFNGKYPYAGGFAPYPALPDQSETIASFLARRGYATVAFTDGIYLAPAYGLDRGFDRFTYQYEPLPRKIDAIEEQLQQLSQSRVPFFLLVHTYAVHEPHDPPVDGDPLDAFTSRVAGAIPTYAQNLVVLSKALGSVSTEHKTKARPYLEALYDADVRQTDQYLNRLLTGFASNGFLDNSVVVITSDHGQELLDHGKTGHGFHLPWPELVHVPFLMRVPGQSDACRVSTVVSQTRLPQVMLNALGLKDVDAFHDPCARDNMAAAFVTNQAMTDYPVDAFLTVGVYAPNCARVWVEDAQTRQVIRTEAITGADDSPSCRAQLPEMESLKSCIHQELKRATAVARVSGPAPQTILSPSNGNPGAAPANPDLEQLRALGYIDH